MLGGITNQLICQWVLFQEPEELEISQDGVHCEEKSSESVTVMTSVPTWFHCENAGSRNGKQKNAAMYSPFHRNPLFAGGQYCAYTELLKLSKHFHPTVTLFANNILQGQQ
jgi:ribosome biogenesis protein MAK21